MAYTIVKLSPYSIQESTQSYVYCNKPHTHTYSTNQVHTQCCTFFSMVCNPEASPCKIKLAGSLFQISTAVTSQLRLNMSNVRKLQGLTKRKYGLWQILHDT